MYMYMYIALRTEEQNLFQMIYHYKRQILSWVLVAQFDFHAFALCLKIDSTTCQVQIDHYCVWLVTSKAMLWKGVVAKRIIINCCYHSFTDKVVPCLCVDWQPKSCQFIGAGYGDGKRNFC